MKSHDSPELQFSSSYKFSTMVTRSSVSLSKLSIVGYSRLHMAAGRQLLCGTVYWSAKSGEKIFTERKRHLLASCGGVENQPAKLELFKYDNAVAKVKIMEFSFCKVTRVHLQKTAEHIKQRIALVLDDGRQFSFCTESDAELERWLECCIVLYRIPNYSIPELPKTKSLKLEGKCSDSVAKRLNALSAWEVFILNNGVGRVLNCGGKHVITFHHDGTFSINNYHTKKCMYTWVKSELKSRPFGYFDLLVYMEIPRHGLLWMYCPDTTMALELKEAIHKFICDKTSTSSSSSMDYHHKVTNSYDSGIGSGQSSYHPDGMPTTTNFVSSFDKNSFTSQDEPLVFPPVEDSPLDLCDDNFNDLNHTPSQGSVTLCSNQCKRKCSSPCLGMKKLHISFLSLPPKFTQEEFEQDGGCSMTLDCSQWKKQKDVLWKCCPLLFHCLDVPAILPYLMSTKLINENDRDILCNDMRTRDNKIHYLIEVLPRKPTLFENFLDCLRQSENGTAHAEIAKKLEELINHPQSV